MVSCLKRGNSFSRLVGTTQSRKKKNLMATNQDPHHGDHMKLFAYAAETVRSHVSVSESLVAATYNNRPTAQVSLGDPHTDNRKLHSKYQAGIPKSVPVKPVPNDDLRIVDMIDGGQTHPFILREEQVCRAV